MDEVRFVDTTLRDGAQSLWASRISNSEMLPVMSDLDAAGYDGIEFFTPAAKFPRAVQELHENPWDWLRLGAPLARNTPLRLHGSVKPIFGNLPSVIREMILGRVAGYGVTTTRVANSWNDYTVLAGELEMLTRHGIRTVADLIYSVSPRHTIEYYGQKAREVAALRPYRVCLKDVGGLLTPERTRELVPVLLENLGDIALELHQHSNNGLAAYCALVAVECGVRIVHTAVPPLAGGYSQPSIFTMARNLTAAGYAPRIDLEPLRRVSEHLHTVARAESLTVGETFEYDETMYAHQVPGGMITNLVYQLRQVAAEARLPEVLDEAGQVRADFGYPIMITPLSQFVGSQAAVNVLRGGDRYDVVTDEAIEYALGRWGSAAIDEMNPEVRAKILDRPRARELEATTKPDPSLEELRARIGNVSDEELILRVYLGDHAAEVFRGDGPAPSTTYAEYRAAHDPVVTILRQFSRMSGLAAMEVHDGEMDLVVRRAVASGQS